MDQENLKTSEEKLSELELEQIEKVRKNNNEISNELGQISIMELQLKQRKEQAEEKFHKYSKEEEELGRDLMDKYGPGRIDIERGVYIKQQSSQ
mgnify:CR=1 FL=1